MMTKSEVARLLARCAVYDQRTVGQADVEGWHEIAVDENWTPAAAHRVVREHYSRGADRRRITPAAITDRLREAQRKAADSFVDPDAIEGESGREYVERKRTLMREHIARVMDAWVTKGEPIPEAATVAELRSGGSGPLALPAGIEASTCPPELRERIERDLARTGRMDRLPTTQAGRDADERQERPEQAGAELAELRDRTARQGESADTENGAA